MKTTIMTLLLVAGMTGVVYSATVAGNSIGSGDKDDVAGTAPKHRYEFVSYDLAQAPSSVMESFDIR